MIAAMQVLLIVLAVIAAAFGLLFATWFHYLAIMGLARARSAGVLRPWAHRFGLLILGVGYLLDFLANMLPLSLLMLELPREPLVTGRVSRHKRNGPGESRLQRWRYAVAMWACSNLLDPFDPDGCHCK